MGIFRRGFEMGNVDGWGITGIGRRQPFLEQSLLVSFARRETGERLGKHREPTILTHTTG